MADSKTLKIEQEGRLRRGSLAELLGSLGLVRATGVVDLTRRKLVRRLVLRDGLIDALISNAREDRFAEWLLQREDGRPESERTARAQRVLASAGANALTGAVARNAGLVPEDELIARLREHAQSMLDEIDEWTDAAFRITPGRVDLGREPRAELPLLQAALVLARRRKSARGSPPPAGLVARPGSDELIPEDGLLSPAERGVLEAVRKPVRGASLIQMEIADAARDEVERAMRALMRVGLIVATTPPSVAEEAKREAAASGDVTETELLQWLQAGERDQLERLLGVAPTASPEEVRKAYYRTVRRFHPDRFREGPMARYHGRVESCFRLVNEALEVLSDPKAKEARERSRREAEAPDPGKLADRMREAARQSVARGKLTEGLRFLERLVSDHGETADNAVPLALLLLSNPRRRHEARTLLERLVERYPQRGDVAAALGLALARSGEDDAARPHLARAGRLAPESPILALARGDAHGREKAATDPFLSPLC